MATRIPALWNPPVAFAHRGASAHARENTLEAFGLARRLGATGIETDVWCTADGVVVCDHDGVVRGGLRRRPISEMTHADLPGHIPTLDELYDLLEPGVPLSVDVKDTGAFRALVEVARARDAAASLWVCHPDLEVLVAWREEAPDVHLVNSTRLADLPRGPERRAADLAAHRIDAVNLHRSEWTGGLTTLFHRFGVLAFGWDAQFERHLAELVHAGIDAVYSDHVDRMVEVIAAICGDTPPASTP